MGFIMQGQGRGNLCNGKGVNVQSCINLGDMMIPGKFLCINTNCLLIKHTGKLFFFHCLGNLAVIKRAVLALVQMHCN